MSETESIPSPALPILTPEAPTIEEYEALARKSYKLWRSATKATSRIAELTAALKKANLTIGRQRSQLRSLNNKWAVLVHATKEARRD